MSRMPGRCGHRTEAGGRNHGIGFPRDDHKSCLVLRIPSLMLVGMAGLSDVSAFGTN